MSRSSRDQRIDMVRGYAIITITVAHFSNICREISYDGVSFPTLTRFGYSSSAELFFLLSGYLVGRVYFSDPATRARRCLTRAGLLYASNAALFVAVALLTALAGPVFAKATYFGPFLDDPVGGTLSVLLFLQHPFLLGILQYYIVFLLAAPLFARLSERSTAAAVLLILGLWGMAQTGVNLPGGTPGGDGVWNFNPFAWQILFFGGTMLGRRRSLERIANWLSANRLRMAGVVLAFLAFTALHQIDERGARFGVDLALPWSGKSNLELMRILHVPVVMAFLLTMLSIPLVARSLRWLAAVGRISLQSFLASVVISYVTAALWLAAGEGTMAYWTLALVSIAASVGFAYAWQWIRRPRLVAPVPAVEGA